MRRLRRSGFQISTNYDKGILLGASMIFSMLLVGVVSSGKALAFFDLPSFLLVIGGTIGATFIHYSVRDVGHAWGAFKEVIRTREYDPAGRIDYLVRLVQTVKFNGPLTLEREAAYADDPFVKMALELAVDNQQPDDISRILETDRRTSLEHSAKAIQVFETMGSCAPALGLIGTLIGLIQMLGVLDNPATVGPAMALALIATFYGVVAANLIFIPIAGKLRNRCEEDALMKALTIEGIVSVIRQEASAMMEQRLQSYLPDKAA